MKYFGPQPLAFSLLLDGEVQFVLPEVLKVPPISNRGNVPEIINRFGGADELRLAVTELQKLLYAA
jgi:type I restriction enzyme R subunit